MMNSRRVLFFLGAVLLFLCYAAPGSAQATRTWVSGVGDDANPCSRTAPCKTFQGAISKTAAGGEISCLDPGGFGSVSITKAITIDCGGVVGSILSSGATGIQVIANAANDVVTIRNLTINGAGRGINGVNVVAAKAVHLESVKITNHVNSGVQVNASASPTLTLKDVTVSDIAGSGVSLTTTAGAVKAELRDVRIWNCATGLAAGANANATVERSSLSWNGSGVIMTAATAQANVAHSELVGNTTAFEGVAGSTVRAVSNTLMQNATAFGAGPTFLTDGENKMVGNTSNGAVTPGSISKM